MTRPASDAYDYLDVVDPTPAVPEAADTPARDAAPPALPFEQSVGYLVSDTHRLLYREVQAKLAPYDVPAGTWFFLRAVWQEDGLTQREVSQRVGILEATTGAALDKLEKCGLIERVRNPADRRKINVYLTATGRTLAHRLIPVAMDLNDDALTGFEGFEVEQLKSYLVRMRRNLGRGN